MNPFRDSQEPDPTEPDPPGTGPSNGAEAKTKLRDELFARIAELGADDEDGAKGIFAAAIQGGLSGAAIQKLLDPLAKALGVKLPYVKTLLKAAEKQVEVEEEVTRRLDPEEIRKAAQRAQEAAEAEARKKQEEAERARREKGEKRAELWGRCREFAMRDDLMDYNVDLTHRRGVVGEKQGIRLSMLSATSRMCLEQALNILRRGAAAAGKNYVPEKVLAYIPPGSIFRITMASATSLFYFDVDNVNSLKGMILYVAEAAAIAAKSGVEHPVTIVLRCLISDGQVDHVVTITNPDGTREAKRIHKVGPTVVMMTTARANVDDEMETRLAVSEADESDHQTDLIVRQAVANASDKARTNVNLQAEVDAVVAHQAWLELGAPYSVTVPFTGAINKAIDERGRREVEEHGGKQKKLLRIRRDINALISAIKASAILHAAKREIDEGGSIIATIDDYRHGRDAVDAGLTDMYKLEISPNIIAVVRVIEKMEATDETGVKVSTRHLKDMLGISSFGTAYNRLKEAENRGFIELVEKHGGYGRTTTHEYRIVESADEIEARVAATPPAGIFPSADEVKKFFPEGGHSAWISGSIGSVGEFGSVGTANCSNCSTVPSTHTPLREREISAPGGSAGPKNESSPETGFSVPGRASIGFVVEKARRLGVTLTPAANDEGLAPFPALPEGLTAQIKVHEHEIVEYLRNEATVDQWLAEHAPTSLYGDNRCMHCGTGADGQDRIEVSNRGFVHGGCRQEWDKNRRAYARIALGIEA